MWFVSLLVGLALQVVSFLIAPKPSAGKPPEVQDFTGPTAEAGVEIPVVFGTMDVKGVNLLWSGEKKTRQYKVKA